MISEQEAIEIMKRYNVNPGVIIHGKGVADFAFLIATRIKERNPQLDVDPQRVKIAALIHDIGKALPGHHETNSVKILEKEGLSEIAHLGLHGGAYELSIIEGREDKELLPKTIENKIIDYADNRFNLKPVTVKERFEELRTRHANNEKLMKILELVEPRMLDTEKEVLELAGYRERDINKS